MVTYEVRRHDGAVVYRNTYPHDLPLPAQHEFRMWVRRMWGQAAVVEEVPTLHQPWRFLLLDDVA